MPQIFEALMVILFGLSWPISIVKSARSRTAKGKSMIFSILISIGYVCGIISKLVGHNLTYVFIFYVINLVAVCIDIGFCLRNKKLDRDRERA